MSWALLASCAPSVEAQRQAPPPSLAVPAANPNPPVAKTEPPPTAPEEELELIGIGAESAASPSSQPNWLELRARAQARILGEGSEVEDASGMVRPPAKPAADRENGNELGHFVAVENEEALGAFHAALEALERGELPGGKLRILAYGASHTQADIFTGYLRYYYQSRFGDAGPGFVPLTKLDKWHRPQGVEVTSHGFTIHHAQRRPTPASGWFGPLGAVAITQKQGSLASFRLMKDGRPVNSTRAAELDILAMGHPEGGELGVFVDGRKLATWSTREDPPRPVVHSAALDAGFSEIAVRPTGVGTIRLFGAHVEWAEATGIVIDTLGISGTRAANWLHWDEPSWREQIARRHPSLVLMAYGTNEATDKNQPIEHYERDLDAVLSRLKRAAPYASCVLVGPGDAVKKIDDKKWIPFSRLPAVIEVQRRQAFEHGCGFWDTRRFMGPGGIARWARANPPMASADLIHLTRRGYVKLGMALGDALLRTYDARANVGEVLKAPKDPAPAGSPAPKEGPRAPADPPAPGAPAIPPAPAQAVQ